MKDYVIHIHLVVRTKPVHMDGLRGCFVTDEVDEDCCEDEQEHLRTCQEVDRE